MFYFARPFVSKNCIIKSSKSFKAINLKLCNFAKLLQKYLRYACICLERKISLPLNQLIKRLF